MVLAYQELERRRLELSNLGNQISTAEAAFQERYGRQVEGENFIGSSEQRNIALERQRKAQLAQEQLKIIKRMGGNVSRYTPIVKLSTKEAVKATEQYQKSTGQEYESYTKEAESLKSLGEDYSKKVDEFNLELGERTKFINSFLQSVSEGKELVQTVDISTSLRGRRGGTFVGRADIKLPSQSEYTSGETSLPMTQEQLEQWGITRAKEYYGLGAEDVIRIDGRAVQESPFSPEEISIANQVFSGRQSVLAQYESERELQQDRLKLGWKFAQQDTAKLQALFDQSAGMTPTQSTEFLKDNLKGSLGKETLEGVRWEVGGVSFSKADIAEQYAKQTAIPMYKVGDVVFSKMDIAEQYAKQRRDDKLPLFIDTPRGREINPEVFKRAREYQRQGEDKLSFFIDTPYGRGFNPEVFKREKEYQRKEDLKTFTPIISEQESMYLKNAATFPIISPEIAKDMTVLAEKMLVPNLLVKQITSIFADVTGTEEEKKIASEELRIARGQFYKQQKEDVINYGTPLATAKGVLETIPGMAYSIGTLTGAAVQITKAGLIKGSEILLTNHNAVARIFGSSLSLTSRAIEPAVGAVFVGQAGLDIAQAGKRGGVLGTGEALGTAAVYIGGFPFAISGYKAGKGIAERYIIDPLATRGMTLIPKEQIIAPEVLSGDVQFYTTKSGDTVARIMGRFYKTEFGLPEEQAGVARMWHGTAQPIQPQVPLRSLADLRPSDVTGMYGSTALSKWFLRLGSPENPNTPKLPMIEKLKFWLLGSQDVFPKGARITLKGIERLPPEARYNTEAAREFLGSKGKPGRALKGYAYLTSSLESKIKAGGRAEEEVVLSPETFLETVSKKYYTELEGRRVPLEEMLAIGEGKNLLNTERMVKTKPFKQKHGLNYYKYSSKYRESITTGWDKIQLEMNKQTTSRETIGERTEKESEYRRGKRYGIKTVGVVRTTQELDEMARRVLDTSDLYRASSTPRKATERRNVAEIRRLYSEYREAPERRVQPEERRVTPERRIVNEYRKTLERRPPPPERRVTPEEFRRTIDRYERPSERIRTPPYRPTPYTPRTPPYKPPRTPPRTPPPTRTFSKFKEGVNHASKKRKAKYVWDIKNPVPTFESLFGG